MMGKRKQERHMYKIGRYMFVLYLIIMCKLNGEEIVSLLASNNLNHLCSRYDKPQGG